MGAGMVSMVLANHCGLSDRAFRVLVRMAHTSLDTENAQGQPPGVYYGGWELLALTLGRELPEPCGVPSCKCDQCETGAAPCLDRNGKPRSSCRCASCTARDRAQETVRRAISELTAAGLVETTGKAHTGSRQSYRLQLSPTATVPLHPTATAPLSEGEPHRHGGESPTATVPPRNHQEPGDDEDISQEPLVIPPAQPPGRVREGTVLGRIEQADDDSEAGRERRIRISGEPGGRRTSARAAGEVTG